MSPQQPADASQLDRVGYLFGYPIAHSLSPPFHQAIFDALGLKWSQQYLESLDIQHFLQLTRDPRFFGAAVTMPHKVAIIPHLDELTSEARDVGACNTVFVRERDGQRVYIGTNTDVKGVKLAFYENVKNPNAVFHDRPAMVIGGGGAARSAVYALRKWMKVKQIYLVNREASEVDAVMQECKTRGYGEDLVHVKTIEQAQTLEGPGAIVACVPDFPPKTDAEKVARGIIEVMLGKEHKGAILEMCYHPNPWTAIAGIAEKHRWQVILGTEAMIWQGLEQSRYWRDEEVPQQVVKKVHEVIAAKLSEMRSTSTTSTSISASPAQAVQQEEMTPVVPPTTS